MNVHIEFFIAANEDLRPWIWQALACQSSTPENIQPPLWPLASCHELLMPSG